MADGMTMKNKRRAGGGAGAGAAVVIVWFAGYMGLSMSAEQGAVFATLLAAIGAEVWSHGIRGVLVHIWAGDESRVVVHTDEAKVIVDPVDDEHPDTEVQVKDA